MNWKKSVSGFLAAALVVTSIVPGTANAAVTNVKAADTELIAHYAFDGDLVDSVSKKSATLTGSLVQDAATATEATFTTVTGTDKAIKFTGENSYGVLLDAASVPTGDTYTISNRIKVNASTVYSSQVFFADVLDGEEAGDLNFTVWTDKTVNAHERMALGRGWKGEGDYMCWSNNGSDAWGDDVASGSNVQKTGEWAVFTAVVEKSKITFYKNGQLVSSSSNLKFINDGTAAMFLGVNYWDTPFDGEISDLQIFDTALTAEQVKDVFNSQSTIDDKLDAFGVKAELPEAVDASAIVAGSDPISLKAVLPDGVTASDVTITFASDNDAIVVTQDTTDKTKATITVPADVAEGVITITAKTDTVEKSVELPVKVVSNNPENNFIANGFDVSKSLYIRSGKTSDCTITLCKGVNVADLAEGYPKFEMEDTTVATVESDALVATVTGVKDGKTTLTVKVKVGDTEKSKTVDITVKSVPENLVAEYTFDEETLTNTAGDSQAEAVVKGLGAYSKALTYTDGISGKALKTGSYGIRLNQKNLGKEFTISAWIKVDGTIKTNSPVLFLGNHSPELWMGISGESNSNTTKLWGWGGIFSTWTTVFSPNVPTEWQYYTIVGKDGEIEFYRNGISEGKYESNNPLDGESQDIYFAANYWDDVCAGAIDSIKVYNKAFSAEEVVEQEDVKAAFESAVDNAISAETIKGDNASLDAVMNNLELPTAIGTSVVTWTSSNPDVIGNDGIIKDATTAEEVELTAVATLGSLTKELSFTVKVVALTEELKAELAGMIAEAEKVDTTYFTEEAKELLETSIAAAKEAKTYPTVNAAKASLTAAMAGDLIVEYADPFSVISAPAATKAMKVGESAQLLVIPVSVKDYVDVTYLTSDESVITNVNGKVTAKKAGKATVTAIVTAKSDGFVMEYSVAVDVSAAPAPAPVTPVKPAEKPLPVNTVEKVDKVAYTVVNANAATPEVAFASTNKKASKVKIPATVTIKGVTYKVTGIANNAFKGNTKLKSITIPAGIKTIGKNAFSGCKNLKKITIKSTTITKVGSSAFKKINAKATIKVPKSKKKAYTKLFKKKGLAKTVKIK